MDNQATLPHMSTRTNVSQMDGQGFVHGVYSLVNPQIGTTRNGEPFLKCLLRDATGEAIGRMWRFDPSTMQDISSTGFVRIEGTQEMYQEKLQIKIGEIWPHEPSSEELTELLPCSRKNIDEMFSEVTALLDSLEHPIVWIAQYMLKVVGQLGLVEASIHGCGAAGDSAEGLADGAVEQFWRGLG